MNCDKCKELLVAYVEGLLHKEQKFYRLGSNSKKGGIYVPTELCCKLG